MNHSERDAPVRAQRRRRLLRGLCASALAAMAWGASGQVADAASPPSLQAPALSAAFTGLQIGSQGTDVKALQQALMDAGIFVRGGADGVFGPVTKQAVITFQGARGLPATGVVDQATSSALATNAGGGSSSSGVTGLARGAQGAAVRAVQERLIASGVFLAGGADGVFGAATERAVRQFQGWNGLDVTGTVNAATASKLAVSESNGSPSTDPAPTAAPATASDSNAYVGLARGSRGPLVVQLQQALQATGLVLRGGADGDFGAVTEASLAAFQRANSLPASGVLSSRGAQLLNLGTTTSTPAPTAAPAVSTSYLGLENGSRGSAVREVQQALITAGVTVRGGADGVFGNLTEAALRSYQTALGITADGTVNQATLDMLGLGSGTAPTPLPAATPLAADRPAEQTPVVETPSAASSNPYVGLSVGSQGDLVKELQVALQGTGLVVRGGADGVFGVSTKTALLAFQSVNGIPTTGVVTERGAELLKLGSGTIDIAAPSSGGGSSSGAVRLERFPVQGACFFGDTWHAPRGGDRLHEGVDIIASEGKLLYAVVDGEISKLYWDSPGALAGNGLRIAQPDGTYFTYLHLQAFAPGIRLGTEVKAGDVIGFVGNTGSSATPHLHFEIHPDGGAPINPYPYVKAIDDCSNTAPQYQSSFT